MGISNAFGSAKTDPCAGARARSLGAKSLANQSNDLTGGRHDTKESEGASVNHCFAIDKHLELAIATVLGIDVSRELATHAGRHTDGMDA